jgi:hypothetical protein
MHKLKKIKAVKLLPEPCRENRLKLGNVDRRGFVREASVLVLLMGRFVKYTFEMASGRMMHIPVVSMISSGI